LIIANTVANLNLFNLSIILPLNTGLTVIQINFYPFVVSCIWPTEKILGIPRDHGIREFNNKKKNQSINSFNDLPPW
jgi:hypothetical protein